MGFSDASLPRAKCSRQIQERKRLQPDCSRTGECREKDAVTAKQHIPDTLNRRDAKAHARLEHPDMPRPYSQAFSI